jgi:hypothetical protein
LIFKEILIGSSAKLVATVFLSNEEFSRRVVIIADITVNINTCLKVFDFLDD